LVRIFKQYIPSSFFVLATIEFLLSLFAIYLSVALRFMGANKAQLVLLGPINSKAFLFALVIFICLAAMGLYQRRFRHGTAGMIIRLSAAFVVALVALSLLNYLIPSLYLGRGVTAIAFILDFLMIFIVRLIFLRTIDQDTLKRRVLVLGAGTQAQLIMQKLRRRTDRRGFVIVGYVHVRGEHDAVDESLIIRPDVPLLALTVQLQIDEIVIAVGDRRRKSFPVHELLDCKLSGVDVIDLLGFFEREVGKIKLDILNPSWMIFSDGFNQSHLLNLEKRIFDVGVASLLLLISWPAMILVVLAIKLEDGIKAPIIYRQVRVGQHWKLFNVYKFRSMKVDAEQAGAQWSQKNDRRITRVGDFIRKVRLDELPQIFNVLKGNMSFVGPRPERPEFVTKLTDTIPYYAERHRVKPGITGWAQVCYPYGASEQDSLEKLQYDLFYIKNHTLFLDFVIILQTANEVLFEKSGR